MTRKEVNGDEQSSTTNSVLYVDDPKRIGAVAAQCRRAFPRLSVVGVTDRETAEETLAAGEWDCVVLGAGVGDPAPLRERAACPVETVDGERPADVLAAIEPHLDAWTTDRERDLLAGVVRELCDAERAVDLTRGACERIAATPGVRLAWAGGREGGNDCVSPEVVAGDEGETGDQGAILAAGADHDAVARALTERSSQIVRGTDEWTAGTTSADAVESHGLASLAVVPVVRGAAVHGVLVAYGTRADAFDGIDDALVLAGRLVGSGLTALAHRDLVGCDRALELTFRTEGTAWSPSAVASVTDARITALEPATAAADPEYADDGVSLRVEGAPVEGVRDRLADCDGVTDARVVSGIDGERVVAASTDRSLANVVADAGAHLEEAVAAAGETRVVVRAVPDADLRAIHDAIRQVLPDAELAAKKERKGSTEDDCRSEDCPDARVLTDRQTEVLRAAYRAGYYEWPRDTTAEELADSLDIASPTLHQHLRRAQRNLLDGLFEGA